ncbi:B12-binding domain-containing radical SAM protein [Curvivirga sp.]|uniref:B12-binding domain-containing radical SAM protein n=1 Tax=Curvivirga sp. TaxID=2856848 RepID=UPI003B594CDF
MVTNDIVLINPGGRGKIYQSLGKSLTAIEPPLWCRLIAGYLLDRGFSVQILDTEAMEMSDNDVISWLEENPTKLVSVVVFGHQPSASTQMMAPAGQLCKKIKKELSHQKISIVGGHVSALPERTVLEEAVDFACVGEGPRTLEGILKVLSSENEEKDFSDIPGICYLLDGKVIRQTPPPLIEDLDKDLHGNTWHLLPMEKYRAHNWHCFGQLDDRMPYASIYTTLGCPYKCVFCCINAPFDSNRYRCRSPQAVVAEIETLYHDYGVKSYKIIDEMFVLKRRHYIEICELLAQKEFSKDLNIWAYARVDTIKQDTLELMFNAGIKWLALGIESGSELVRDGAEKSFSQQDIRDIVKSIQDAGINVIGNFIFGLPDDTHESMRETFDLAKELNCEFVNFYAAMAYPGSALYMQAVNNNIKLPDDWAGYSQHSVNCLPMPTVKLSAAQVLKFRDDAFHDFFDSEKYLNMISSKFGTETREHIKEMAKVRLTRNLL